MAKKAKDTGDAGYEQDETADTASASNPDDVSKDSWDNVTAPIPFPNGLRVQFRGIGASYKKPAEDGDDHVYNFGFKPEKVVSVVDAAELPQDWQSMKVWVRFRVPSFNSHFDAKAFFETCGINTAGLNRDQACAAFKKAKPLIEGETRFRSWTNRSTGVQQWEQQILKPELVDPTKAAAQADAGEDED